MERPQENDEIVKRATKYIRIMEWIFERHYEPGKTRVPFKREELVLASEALGFKRIKNLGDVTYTFRFRRDLPNSIQHTAPSSKEWIILGAGIGSYEFRLASSGKVNPSPDRHRIKVPDATPEIVRYYAPGRDEQALLARVRYNRLIDIFTGLTCYSVQNHLRTTVAEIGQVEVDEIYVGLNHRGTHFVLPCQAKSVGDRFGIGQVLQDIELCRLKYPTAICRPIAIQFVDESSVALLELSIDIDTADESLSLSVKEERHYTLVPRSELNGPELQQLIEEEQ